MYGLSDIGIQVHGINKIHIRILFTQILHCCNHTDESVTEVLPAVSGNENQFTASVKTTGIIACLLQYIYLLMGQSLIGLELTNYHVERVYNGVSGYKNSAVSILILEILLA